MLVITKGTQIFFHYTTVNDNIAADVKLFKILIYKGSFTAKYNNANVKGLNKYNISITSKDKATMKARCVN